MARLAPVSVPSRIPFATMIRLADSRLIALALSLFIAVGAGLVSSIVAPRGPTTASNALLVMVLALLVGAFGGLMVRTRWVLLPLVVSLAIGIELGRLEVVGASLDIRLDNTYGIIAFALTRGVHTMLVVPALALGVLVGIATTRRMGWILVPDDRRRAPIGAAILGLGVIALALLIAWPASTPPVVGEDGKLVPGSIAELTTVQLGGADQAVMIRAADPSAPVILYLAGGPGQSDLALTRAQTSELERDFVWVGLDQRGNGKSYPAIDPVAAVTVEQGVSDVIELTEYLRDRFDERKVYLMGESWGTILGVLAVQQRPDLYHAWIPSGQMVDVAETDRRVYDDLVAYAQRTNDDALMANLRAVGEPPYRDIPWANSNLLAWYEYLYRPYAPSQGYIARGEAARLDPWGTLGSEYSVIEKADVLRGLIDTFTVLYPQLYDIDLRESANRLEVPVYFLDGEAELAARRDPALEWFQQLDAPIKEHIAFKDAAHAVAFEQLDEVHRLLNETIVPATYDRP